MLSKEELINLTDLKNINLTSNQLNARKSVLSRKLPYYGKIKSIYHRHWSSFVNMHKRGNVSKEFSRDVEGFINFILYIGDIPDIMINPSVGRINHDIGYIRGNFRWQSLSDNQSEMAIRTNSKSRLSSGYIQGLNGMNSITYSKIRKSKVLKILETIGSDKISKDNYNSHKLHNDPKFENAILEFPELF